MQELVQSGRVIAVITSDTVRISGMPANSAMQRKMFRVADTKLSLGIVGVDPAEHLDLEQQRKEEQQQNLQQRNAGRDELVRALNDNTRKMNATMLKIAKCKAKDPVSVT